MMGREVIDHAKLWNAITHIAGLFFSRLCQFGSSAVEKVLDGSNTRNEQGLSEYILSQNKRICI